MRKIIATLAAVAGLAVVATPASAAPFATFSAPTAFNGAHAYARAHMDGVPNVRKTVVDCLTLRPASVTGRSAAWLCAIDTYSGVSTLEESALVEVLRKDGRYVFRPVDLVAAGA